MATAYSVFDEIFDTYRYPAGESHVRLKAGVQPDSIRVVEARVRNFDDLGNLLTADRILKRLRIGAEWFVPYFPFARHDRRIDSFDGLELQVALDMVRGLDITVADPHSDVLGVLPNFSQAGAVKCMESAGLFKNDAAVVIPDAGAAKKVHSWSGTRDTVQCNKRRDMVTGKLSGFEVLAGDLEGRPCVIVDDICDAGGTFLGLAAELKKKNAGPLTLAVTHGLFTKGLDSLSSSFANIFTFAPTGTSVDGTTCIPFKTLFEQGVRS